MKILVIGGTNGIGKAICEHYSAVGVGKSNGHSYPEEAEKVRQLSMKFDIIINCIPDRYQTDCVRDLVELHSAENKKTYFITIGSLSYKINAEDHPKNILYNYVDKILFENKSIRHTLVNPAEMFNSKNDRFFSRISKEDFFKILDCLLSTEDLNINISSIDIHGKLIIK